MEQHEFIKQTLDFNKNAFNTVFNALVVLQDHTEKICNTALENAGWIPKEGKKAIGEWIESYKKGRESYKNAVINGFQHLDGILGSTNKA